MLIDAKRSRNMAKIKGRNTAPELKLRKALWHSGLRYRVNLKIHRILPDIVFPSRKIAIFIDGCFWHGCPIHYVFPRTNTRFWQSKLNLNVKRDMEQTVKLLSLGWKVLRFWEHEIDKNLDQVLRTVIDNCNIDSLSFQDHYVILNVELLNDNHSHQIWTIGGLLGMLPPTKKTIIKKARLN